MRRWMAMCVVMFLPLIGVKADNFWGVYLSYWDTADLDSGVGPGIVFSAEMVPAVQLEARVSLFDDVSDGGAGGAANIGIVPVELGLTAGLPMGESVRGYAGIGAGYYFVDAESDPAAGVFEPDDELGYYGVAGFDLPVWQSDATYGVTRALLFAEAMYRVLELDFAGPAGGSGGTLDLDGVVVNAGLLIGW